MVRLKGSMETKDFAYEKMLWTLLEKGRYDNYPCIQNKVEQSSRKIETDNKPKTYWDYYEKKVNLRVMPLCLVDYQPGTCFHDGDNHGHVMKRIYTLIKFGIITNMTDEWYQQLYKIYDKPIKEYTQNELDNFEFILSQLKFNSQMFYHSLGDDVGDRGKLDELTFLLNKYMIKNKVLFKTNDSNHGREVIVASEMQSKNPAKEVKFVAQDMPSKFAVSMENLEVIIANGLITREKIFKHINKYYKPFLEAVSYTLDGDTIILFTHAAFGLQDIHNLGKHLGVILEFSEEPVKLAKYIDEINLKYQSHVQNNTVHTLYRPGDGNFSQDFTNYPFLKLLWNRYYDENLDRPIERNGFKYIFVHGHDDGPELKAENVFVLNNNLGKGEGCDEGELHVYITVEKNFKLVDQKMLGTPEIIPRIITNTSHQKKLSWDNFPEENFFSNVVNKSSQKNEILLNETDKLLLQNINNMTKKVKVKTLFSIQQKIEIKNEDEIEIIKQQIVLKKKRHNVCVEESTFFQLDNN